MLVRFGPSLLAMFLIVPMVQGNDKEVFGLTTVHEFHLELSAKEWEQMQKVESGRTIFGPRKSQKDFAVMPATYTANPRKEIVIADAQSTKGIYPKLFIASGKELPAKTQDGKVIHVPYSDLLNADGTPKAAKDIWAILTKAGVSRYAEIICVSDDPGEAAANYFILKLMGFADIKVLENAVSVAQLK